jgi:hypothetical protein
MKEGKSVEVFKIRVAVSDKDRAVKDEKTGD